MPISLLPLPSGCATDCPACKHRQWPMAESLAQKQDFLAQTLAAWGTVLEPVASVPEVQRWGYRGKVKLAARWMHHEWTFGLEPRDDFIAIPNCPVQTPLVTAAMEILGQVMPRPEKWPLRYYVQNGGLVTLVLKTQKLPAVEGWLTDEVKSRLATAGVQGLHVNLHPAAGRILFSKNWHCLWGETRVQDALGLWHGPGAFQQQLPGLYAQSLAEAETFLGAGEAAFVADLYCGVGASLQCWTGAGARAAGVELDAEAIACAQLNAPGATVLRGLCAQRVPQLSELAAGDAVRLAYVNPPRLGLEPEVLSWLVEEFKPQRLAYLSCSAGTLRRDLAALEQAGWRVTALKPFDFFPQTHHVEVLALVGR